jgi:3-hydroxyacyl-CoA dehydrogenase/enoyl-CoA hydratase/3-hydroxybutyryl-CoA epimerase
VVSSDARNLIRLFDAVTELKKAHEAPQPRPVGRVGVLGAGLMGEGIAAATLPLCPVVLKDVSTPALARAAGRLHAALKRRRRSGAMARVERDRQWFRLHLAPDASALAGADLVVEAVFEDLELKRRVLAETEAVIDPRAVFASNTSAIPIADIARGAAHPERVLGMHYFSPVPKMPLVEIVRSERTSDVALATARAFAAAQGKTVVVVKDGPGFYTTRILAPYLNEAVVLLEEGAEIAAIDAALVDFGFLVGPLALLDEVGLDVGAHVTSGLSPLFSARGTPPSETLPRLVAAGFLGKKNGRGFYRRRGHRKEPSGEVPAFLGRAARADVPERDLTERCVLTMVNESVRCLGEGIVGSARDADVAAIFGLGFPPFRGGPLRYVDALGAQSVVERLTELARRHGARFTPAPLLVERANDGRRFTS